MLARSASSVSVVGSDDILKKRECAWLPLRGGTTGPAERDPNDPVHSVAPRYTRPTLPILPSNPPNSPPRVDRDPRILRSKAARQNLCMENLPIYLYTYTGFVNSCIRPCPLMQYSTTKMEPEPQSEWNQSPNYMYS